MTGGVRLFIVTDDPHRAALYFFARDPEFVPGWARMVSTVQEIGRIPDGARATAVWFKPADLRQERWILRRTEVRIVGDHFEILDAIRAWLARPFEPEPEDDSAQPVADAPPVSATLEAPEPEAPAPPETPRLQKPAAPRWT
jgi:hypothetical protein